MHTRTVLGLSPQDNLSHPLYRPEAARGSDADPNEKARGWRRDGAGHTHPDTDVCVLVCLHSEAGREHAIIIMREEGLCIGMGITSPL